MKIEFTNIVFVNVGNLWMPTISTCIATTRIVSISKNFKYDCICRPMKSANIGKLENT